MIRAIFFDLDDTLIGYAEADRIAMEAGHAVVAARNPAITKEALSDAIITAYNDRYAYGCAGFVELKTLSNRELRRILTATALEHLGEEPETDFVDRLVESYENAERDALKLFVDTTETLDTLAERLPLGVITNGPSAMQREKLAGLGLSERFRVIVVDTEFGHSKPDTRIFAHAAEAIGLKPQELLFVGNSPEADVTGAVRSDWTSVWLNSDGSPLPAGTPLPHYTISRLAELLTLPPVVAAIRGD